MPDSPSDLVFVDVETTGLDPALGRVIEIAAIRFDANHCETDTLELLIDPQVEVPSGITDLTGITTSMLKEQGVPTVLALQRLREFAADAPLVAFNASFDRDFINYEFKRAGLSLVANQWRCALEAARQAWPVFRSHRLQSLSTFFHLAPQDHRALSDCRLGAQIFFGAISRLQSGSICSELGSEELRVTSIDIDNLYACKSGDLLTLWTVPDFERINAYAPGSMLGSGFVAAFEKARNPWLAEKFASKEVRFLRVEVSEDRRHSLEAVVNSDLDAQQGDP
jgi:DNA polymerase-3 subunit epsilon